MPEMMHIALVSADFDRMADLREQIEAGGDMRVTVFSAHAPGISVDEAERIDLAVCFDGETGAVLRGLGYRGPVLVPGVEVPEGDGVTGFALPFRIAAFLARIRVLITAYRAQSETYVTIGPYRLRRSLKMLEDGRGKSIKLTEKETEILLFMHRSMGALITREALLAEVWGYSKGITTHTVETHIYRLRQKIDARQVFATEAGGYRVMVGEGTAQ
ncbi:MAG: response regulator transcription factor [Hyphomicrobiales bacterium]